MEMQESQRTWNETAKAQQESQKAHKDQAESLFLAAYLNALVAVRDAPPMESLSDAQRESLERIEGLASRLEDRANQILGQPATRSVQQRMAERIEHLAKVFHTEWIARRQTIDPIAFTASKEALDRCRSEFRRMLGDLDPYFEQDASRILELSNRLCLREDIGGGPTGDVENLYTLYWTSGDQLWNDLRLLAAKLAASSTAEAVNRV
jgi:hypothetical protein